MHANPTTSVSCFPYLSAEMCDAALQQLDPAGWKPGRIAQPTQIAGHDHVVRSCSLNATLDAELLARIEGDVMALNTNLYKFALEGLSKDDPITVMRYEPSEHFVWHIDNGAAAAPFATRKLSFSIQLSDPDSYEGGNLELAMYTQAYGDGVFDAYQQQIRQRGAIVVFPSFHLHRVSPVTQGTRHAIVGWLHGPPFV